jgi:hypothetical protein
MSGGASYFRPPLLEQLGALCSLMAHDLANQLCVISGSASFGQMNPEDPKRLATALHTIARASETAGHTVSSFAEYRRTLPTTFVPSPAKDVVHALASYAEAMCWAVTKSRNICGHVLLPPSWAVFAAQSIRSELRAPPIKLKISMCERGVSGCHGPACGDADSGAQRKQGLQILFSYQAEAPLSIRQIRTRYENLEFLAAFELNRMLGGTLESKTRSGEHQIIDLWLPLEGVQSKGTTAADEASSCT